ncbi:MAG TPA: hypothetical protein VHO07_09505 [Streptosporangiaceae bacterium]|nr:hypothetical protein [Streptosporangiaceae bacterium]
MAEAADQLHRLHDAAAVLRAHPDYAAPQAKVDAIVALLQPGRFPLLELPAGAEAVNVQVA